MKNYGPAWLEIDMDALAFNMRNTKNYVTNTSTSTKVLAVVKADGYGHGALEASKIFMDNGADYLGVATIFEALELRKKGISEFPILNFSYTPENYYVEAVKNNITLTIYTYDMALRLSEIGEALAIKPKVHLKIDTGMSRLGFLPTPENIEVIAEISKLHLEIEGIYSHFATADSSDKKNTHNQAVKFQNFIDELEKLNINFDIKHICNSAAMMELPEYHFDMVRAGGILYGHFCLLHYLNKSPFEVRQALSIRALVSNVNILEPDTGVSYGWFYKTSGVEKIGTLPIGYTDGINRKNTNNAEFLIKGERIKQVGLICMDQMMINLTNIDDVKIGDVVTLLGSDGNEHISLEERASAASTGKCELFAGIGHRLPKVYFKDNQHYKTINYLY